MRKGTRGVWRRQWSFLMGGAAVGLGEALYYIRFGTFIPVTTGLAKMFATVEENILGVRVLAGLYPPDIHWIIVGAIFGAWLVGRLEGESRNWVRYTPGMLALALLGGVIFGFGTRLGPGCTTHHVFGGLAVMSIASSAIALAGLPFAFLAFSLVAGLGYGPYFKHQENLATVREAKRRGMSDDHRLCYDEAYRPWRDPVRMVVWCILAVFIISSLYTGLFGTEPHMAQSVRVGSLSTILTGLAAGILLGFGIAKGGVGTECGLMAPESLAVSRGYYDRLRIPAVTRRMFQALMPVAGILAAIGVLNIAVLVGWIFFGRPLPDAAPKPEGWGLHVGHLLAAPCLAVGSVLMIGCEIRSYGRIGLGYLTGMVGLIGFYIGYVPYVRFHTAIDGFIARHVFLRATNWPQLIGGDNLAAQYAVGVAYTALLFVLLAAVVRHGARGLGATAAEYVFADTDSLCMRAERAGLEAGAGNRGGRDGDGAGGAGDGKEGKMEKRATVYGTETCPWCARAKQYLEGKGVAVEYVDVGADHARAQEMMRKSGQMGVPVIEIGAKLIVGFDREVIDGALGA